MAKRILLAGAAALAFLGACASQSGTSVTDLQLARVPAQELDAVNTQRLAVASAQDTVARQELALQSARNERRLAQEEVRATQAEIPRVKLALDNAAFNRDSAAHENAARELQALYAREDAARAHVLAADAGVSLAEAQKREARQRLDLAQAQLDWAKFEALQRIRDPAAREINTTALLRRLRVEQKDVREASDEVAQRQVDASHAQRAWRASAQRYESLRGFGGAGR